MSSVGLVLGGGGVTGAAYQTGVLTAIQLATGWDPRSAEVVVGTSGGAVVAAMARGPGVSMHALVGDAATREEFAGELRSQIFQRTRLKGVARWARHGLLRGLRHPGVNFVLGTPAPYRADGIGDWVNDRFGPFHSWPDKATVIASYDLASGRRVAFGTQDNPDVALPEAVAASCAVPLFYEPYRIDGRDYVDAGVVSGTNADLVLGAPEPLDLLIIIAPIGVSSSRSRQRFYEPMFDRAGRLALGEEIERIEEEWPNTEILVMTPSDVVLAQMRPNPMSPEATVPTFIRTLRSMKRELAEPETWAVLERHLEPTLEGSNAFD